MPEDSAPRRLPSRQFTDAPHSLRIHADFPRIDIVVGWLRRSIPRSPPRQYSTFVEWRAASLRRKMNGPFVIRARMLAPTFIGGTNNETTNQKVDRARDCRRAAADIR